MAAGIFLAIAVPHAMTHQVTAARHVAAGPRVIGTGDGRIGALSLSQATAAQGSDITVTLLGTGCPPPVLNRLGPSILVEAGTHRFVFDAGRGALQRLAQRGIRWQDIGGDLMTIQVGDQVQVRRAPSP